MRRKEKRRATVVAWAAMLAVLGCAMAVTTPAGVSGASPAEQKADSPATGGRIVGVVNFRGEAPKFRPISMEKDPVCASEHEGPVLPEDGRVNANGTLPNAFIYIEKGTGDLSVPTPQNSESLTQKNCMYEPHVMGIMVNQPLQVVTLDPTTHNIHFTPKINRDWDVSQEPGSPSVIHTFSKPEVMIPVHCNVHPWMKAYLGVVTNPYYAVTGDEGKFQIDGVPPGEYTLAGWTATFGAQQRRATVRAGETTTVDFTFSSQ